MSWLDYWEANKVRLTFRYTRTDQKRGWGRPNARFPRRDGNRLYVPKSAYADAGYIDLDTHEIVYNRGCDEYGKIGIQMLFKELSNIE